MTKMNLRSIFLCCKSGNALQVSRLVFWGIYNNAFSYIYFNDCRNFCVHPVVCLIINIGTGSECFNAAILTST